MTGSIEFLVHMVALLERLGIAYHVGGSIASSAHGRPRSTVDLDIVIDPTEVQLEALAQALEREHYVSRTAIEEARKSRGTFNAIHQATSLKADFFIKGNTPFDAEELRRSIRHPVGDEQGSTMMVKSAEDTVLRKLDWFRRGREVSKHQWDDVVSVFRVSGKSLDAAYLDLWAARLGVTDLLNGAREKAAEVEMD